MLGLRCRKGKLSGFGCRPDEKDVEKSAESDNHIVGSWMPEQASCRVLNAKTGKSSGFGCRPDEKDVKKSADCIKLKRRL
ncbi:MAG: hypothetical protein RR347_08975, partial [Anaerovoracaceae bacterium]